MKARHRIHKSRGMTLKTTLQPSRGRPRQKQHIRTLEAPPSTGRKGKVAHGFLIGSNAFCGEITNRDDGSSSGGGWCHTRICNRGGRNQGPFISSCRGLRMMSYNPPTLLAVSNLHANQVFSLSSTHQLGCLFQNKIHTKHRTVCCCSRNPKCVQPARTFFFPLSTSAGLSCLRRYTKETAAAAAHVVRQCNQPTRYYVSLSLSLHPLGCLSQATQHTQPGQ